MKPQLTEVTFRHANIPAERNSLAYICGKEDWLVMELEIGGEIFQHIEGDDYWNIQTGEVETILIQWKAEE